MLIILKAKLPLKSIKNKTVININNCFDKDIYYSIYQAKERARHTSATMILKIPPSPPLQRGELDAT
jgi:hypothetical protein